MIIEKVNRDNRIIGNDAKINELEAMLGKLRRNWIKLLIMLEN